MHIAIGCCRKNARLYHKTQSKLTENEDELLAMEKNRNDVLYGFSGILFIVQFFVSIAGFILSQTGKGVTAVEVYYVDRLASPPKTESADFYADYRDSPQIGLEKNGKGFLTYAERVSTLKRVCGAIELDDPTYKAMKINFDDAVLYETLKLKGNSRNRLKSKRRHLIL